MATPRKLIAASAICCVVVGIVLWRGVGQTRRGEDRGDRLRVVSLAPSATEILFRLGAGDSLIGVTDCCDFPAEAKQIECVGGFGTPNVEKLLSLSPDCVIAVGLEQRNVVGILQGAGIQVLDVQIRDFEELFEAIRQIGTAVNRPRQAQAIIAEMQADLKAITGSDMPASQRPRVFIEVSESPLTTAGGTSFLDDLVARAGGVNVAHDVREAYFQVSSEKVIEWNPHVILAARMRPSPDAVSRFARRIGWAGVSAVKDGRIIDDIPPDLLFRPGPRLVDGLKALAARLHRRAPEPKTAKEGGG